MNQTTESSAGVPFVTNSLNIQTTGDNTIEIIDHELIIEVLPINDPITNTTFITTDAFNRLHNSPISAIPGSLPTIDFIASNIAAPDSLVSIDATNTLNKSQCFTNFAGDLTTPGSADLGGTAGGTYPTSTIKINSTHSQLSTYSDAGDPQVNISTKTQFGSTSGALNIGCYEDESGIMKMAPGGTSAFSVFRNLTDVWLGSSRSDPGDPGTCEFFTGLNMRPAFTRWYTRCFFGDGLTISPPLPAKLCVLDGSINEARPINRAQIFNQDMTATSDVVFNSVTTDLIEEEGSNAGITLNNRVILPNITPQNSNNLLLTVDLVSFNVEKSPILTSAAGLINTGEGYTPIHLMDQNIRTTDSVEFLELSVGPQTVTPATDTRSQLKISGPLGDLGPFPKNDIGGRIEIYNDGNQYPLVSLSCFRPDDCALSFGSFGSSIDPWVKSDINFFKWQKLTAELGLYCNQTLSVAGTPAFEELMVNYNNTGLNPVIEYHQPVKLFSTASAPTNSRFLTLNNVSDEIEERILPAFGTGDVSWVGVGSSIDNSIPRFDGVSGLIIQGSNIIIDDSDNITGATSLNTGQGANLLYSMDQDTLSTSNVTFNNIFSNSFIQTDQINENTINNGVLIDSWKIKTQNITSDALSDVNDPLSINLKYFADSNIPLSITAPAHDDLSINFDCHNVVGFPDSYISGSVLGNIILDKNDDLLRVLVTNGIAPAAGFLKSAMNSVFEVGKTFINLNQVATFAAGVVMNALTTDPETQADSIFITQSSLTNEIFKRPYQSVYCTAVNTASVTTPLVVNVWTVPALVYALTLAKNCTPVSDSIVIDAGIDSHLSSISYDFSFASFDNQAVSYQSAIRINGFIITSSICNFIIDDMVEVHNVANTSIFPVDAGDDISLVVRNILDNKPISISKMAITINKIFQ